MVQTRNVSYFIITQSIRKRQNHNLQTSEVIFCIFYKHASLGSVSQGDRSPCL